MDAGVRWAINDKVRLVAGLFEIEKPYFGLDGAQVYRDLGALRNRGIELSLAGRVTPRLSTVLGFLLLDSTISGTAVTQGLVGKHPVDSFSRYASAGIEYEAPWIKGLSLDFRYENYSDRPADRLNTYVIPTRHVMSAGARYRFKIGDAPTTVRAQVASFTNHYARAMFGEGFLYNVPRRLILSLTSDW